MILQLQILVLDVHHLQMDNSWLSEMMDELQQHKHENSILHSIQIE